MLSSATTLTTYLLQNGHFQVSLGKEYPTINRIMLSFQLTNIMAIYKIKKSMCWADEGTGSNLQISHCGISVDGIGLFINFMTEYSIELLCFA
jgi:hypothetical protein